MPFDNKKFEIENDLNALENAVEVVNDKKRYAAALKLAGEKKKGLEKVTSLRKALTT